MTRKQFNEYASRAQPGEVYRIKRASGWERLKGFDGYYWIDAKFIEYNGVEAIFENMHIPGRKVFVTYRKIKSGENFIAWGSNSVLSINKPAASTKERTVPLWGANAYRGY
jgi:hypothetical protein